MAYFRLYNLKNIYCEKITTIVSHIIVAYISKWQPTNDEII